MAGIVRLPALRLATDRGRTARLGSGARRTAEALSWDMEMDRLDESYREVCEGRAAPRAVTSGLSRPEG